MAEDPPAHPPKPAAPSTPKVVGGFELKAKLGQGGMGSVFRAVQLSMQREVALKVLSPGVAARPGFAARFLREARAMGAINHPNVVTCYDAGQDGKLLYIALELMTGGDAERLKKAAGGSLPVERALQIVRDAALGLGAIHKAGMIHRDIKPANIFLDEQGMAKLADLGLARSEDGDDRMTQTGATLGTPAFMAPEQAEGDEHVDIRADIYALGATLFDLITGTPPYTGPTSYAVVNKVINEPVPDARTRRPGLSDSVAGLCLRCMAKDPADRFQEPAELAAELERLCTDPLATIAVPPPRRARGTGARALAGTKTAPTVRTPLGRPDLRRHAPLLGVAAAALALLILFVWLLRGPDGQPVDQSRSRPEADQPDLPVTGRVPATAPVPAAGPDASAPNPNGSWTAFTAWKSAIATLEPELQVAYVKKAMKVLNPKLENGQTRESIQDGKVLGIEFSNNQLHDLRPLQGLVHLQSLRLGVWNKTPSPLSDLSPLRPLPLKVLVIPASGVTDLGPLAGKNLSELDITDGKVEDLRPVVSPELRRLAFDPRVVRHGLDELRLVKGATFLVPMARDWWPAADFWLGWDTDRLAAYFESKGRMVPGSGDGLEKYLPPLPPDNKLLWCVEFSPATDAGGDRVERLGGAMRSVTKWQGQAQQRNPPFGLLLERPGDGVWSPVRGNLRPQTGEYSLLAWFTPGKVPQGKEAFQLLALGPPDKPPAIALVFDPAKGRGLGLAQQLGAPAQAWSGRSLPENVPCMVILVAHKDRWALQVDHKEWATLARSPAAVDGTWECRVGGARPLPGLLSGCLLTGNLVYGNRLRFLGDWMRRRSENLARGGR